jgi:tetratricopeptide (TPR) repeat protein
VTPRISLCMIVKNEEANLPACLGSAIDLVQEIIVVDTGSTDRTRETAARFGARVVDFPWVDDFSAARNESLRHATGDWVFWLDGDERLDDANRRRFQTLTAGLPNEIATYIMTQLSLPNAATGRSVAAGQARLFTNHPQVRWQYRAHEQIIPAIERLGGSLHHTDLVIEHTGYQDPGLRRRKNERNLRLLLLDLADNPNDAVIHFHIGWAYLDLDIPAEAVRYLHRSLELSPPGISTTCKACALLMNGYYGLGQKDQALAVCRHARARFPDNAEIIFAEGKLLAEAGDQRTAEANLLRILDPGAGLAWPGIDAASFRCQAHYHLGEMYAQQGRAADAEAHLREAIAQRADYTDAWLRLGDLWSSQGRQAELAQLEHVAEGLASTGHRAEDVLLLRVSAQLGRKSFAAARQLASDAVAANPKWLQPRVVLSQVLLLEGRDWAAAERALHDILALDPNNAGARHNLAVLAQMSSPLPSGERGRG